MHFRRFLRSVRKWLAWECLLCGYSRTPANDPYCSPQCRAEWERRQRAERGY